MPLTVEQFAERLMLSGLMPEEQARKLIDDLIASTSVPDGQMLAQQLVIQKHLTRFQAEQIYIGNGASLTLGNYVILDKLGLLNSLVGLVLVYSTTAIPFCVWTLKGYFDTLPRELEEAARIDGASQWMIFRKIILPQALIRMLPPLGSLCTFAIKVRHFFKVIIWDFNCFRQTNNFTIVRFYILFCISIY